MKKRVTELGRGEHGAMFKWREFDKPKRKGNNVWSPFPADTNYFDPSKKAFMFNYRMENLGVFWIRKEIK